MSEELFQSLIRDLEQQKPIRERLAKLKGERLDALKKETEEAIARAKTESSPNREDYAKLREHMLGVTRDILLSSLLEATEGIILSRGVERRQEPEKEQPRAQESAQSSASDQAPKESLNVFEKNPAPAATQKPAMGFREWVRSQRGQSAPAESTWNKIVSWFDVQSPNPEQHYDENIWSRPKYWFAYGVYWLMDWWNGWGKKKSAQAPATKPEEKPADKPAAPADKPVTSEPAKPEEPKPETQQQAPATSAQQTVPADKPAEKPAQPTQPPAPQKLSTTPTPSPLGTASAPAAMKPSKTTNQAETTPSLRNLLDGSEQTINGHLLSFSTDSSSLLKIDGKRYAADWNKIGIHGEFIKKKATSINYVNGEATIFFKEGRQWKISSSELSSLTEKIAKGIPETFSTWDPRRLVVAPNSFLVTVTYLRIGEDGTQSNQSAEIRVRRLD